MISAMDFESIASAWIEKHGSEPIDFQQLRDLFGMPEAEKHLVASAFADLAARRSEFRRVRGVMPWRFFYRPRQARVRLPHVPTATPPTPRQPRVETHSVIVRLPLDVFASLRDHATEQGTSLSASATRIIQQGLA